MDERRRWAGLVGLVALLRLPGLIYGVVDIDESDYAITGRLLRHGALPYVDFVEKKPVFGYLFYSPCSIFGFHMWPMQLLAIAWIGGTAYLCAKAAERWTGRADAGAAAALIAVLATAANVSSVGGELMLNLPQAWALHAYLRHCRRPTARRAAEVGLAIGLAMLFKHQAGILAVAIGLAELWARRGRAVGTGAAMALGLAAPWAAVVALYVAAGHGAEFYEWNVARNLSYSAVAVGSRLGRFAAGFGACVLGGAALWWALAVRGLRRPRREPRGFGLALGLTLLLTWIPVSLGGRFYEHYFLQFVPALAILAGPGLAELWAARASLARGARRALWALAVGPALAFLALGLGRGLARDYPCQEPRTIEVAAWLRAHAAPADTLFVWGHYTPIYYLSDLLPGTRYYNTSIHMGDFDPAHLPDGFDLARYRSARDIALTLDDLERRRPRWFVDTAPADIHHWSRVPLEQFPELARYRDAHYRRVGAAGGAGIYERITGP